MKFGLPIELETIKSLYKIYIFLLLASFFEFGSTVRRRKSSDLHNYEIENSTKITLLGQHTLYDGLGKYHDAPTSTGFIWTLSTNYLNNLLAGLKIGFEFVGNLQCIEDADVVQ